MFLAIENGPTHRSTSHRINLPPIGIGKGSRIRGAIIDKNARIGAEVQIEPFPPGTDIDLEQWTVRDGLVVIAKNSSFPEGTVIRPNS